MTASMEMRNLRTVRIVCVVVVAVLEDSGYCSLRSCWHLCFPEADVLDVGAVDALPGYNMAALHQRAYR
jgi:hypothetical protein